MKKLFVVCIVAIMLAGCSYPAPTVISTPDNRSSIAVSNAPVGAVLIVDGLDMGAASLYDGKQKVLLVEPGTHRVRITKDGDTLISEKLFLGENQLKTFNMGSFGGK